MAFKASLKDLGDFGRPFGLPLSPGKLFIKVPPFLPGISFGIITV
jgi:hypothetical protein